MNFVIVLNEGTYPIIRMKYAGGIQAPGGPHSGDTFTKLLLFGFLLRLLLGLLLGCHQLSTPFRHTAFGPKRPYLETS